MAKETRNEFYAQDRTVWRKWLAKNHATEKNVWLIIHHKKSKTPSVYYDEAVEEALCYGWIDSKPNKRDAESYWLFFAERKPKGVWSKLNKQRIEKLILEGQMTPAGIKKIEQAKQDGSWSVLDAIEELVMPKALVKSFSKNKKALANFEAFPPGVKKGIYQWIISAKTEATLIKRAEETVTLAAKNVRANQWPKQ